MQYETALTSDKFLVIAHGNEEINDVKELLKALAGE
jgi:hypothetical protein